eukprot:4601805-Heterocapsa_arctica.AAC.1
MESSSIRPGRGSRGFGEFGGGTGLHGPNCKCGRKTDESEGDRHRYNNDTQPKHTDSDIRSRFGRGCRDDRSSETGKHILTLYVRSVMLIFLMFMMVHHRSNLGPSSPPREVAGHTDSDGQGHSVRHEANEEKKRRAEIFRDRRRQRGHFQHRGELCGTDGNRGRRDEELPFRLCNGR